MATRTKKPPLSEQEIVIDLDDPETDKQLTRMGGHTLARLVIFQGGRRVVAFVTARVSGDTRAGRTDGVHLTLTVNKRGTETSARKHAQPWLPVCPKCREPERDGETHRCA